LILDVFEDKNQFFIYKNSVLRRRSSFCYRFSEIGSKLVIRQRKQAGIAPARHSPQVRQPTSNRNLTGFMDPEYSKPSKRLSLLRNGSKFRYFRVTVRDAAFLKLLSYGRSTFLQIWNRFIPGFWVKFFIFL
jgi:hypothetical protein